MTFVLAHPVAIEGLQVVGRIGGYAINDGGGGVEDGFEVGDMFVS
jgi:hypothetical protein